MKKYTVTAVPHDGFDAYFRAGHRFGPDATEISVMDAEPEGDAKREPYVLTPSEFDRLKTDSRIRVTDAGGRVVGEAPPKPAPTAEAEPTRDRTARK